MQIMEKQSGWFHECHRYHGDLTELFKGLRRVSYKRLTRAVFSHCHQTKKTHDNSTQL